MFALVTSNTIQAVVGKLPLAARRLDTGQWVLGLRDATVATQQACGWFAVVDVPRPAETDTTTHDRSVELVANAPTVVWTARPWTVDELAARQQDTNRTAIDAAIVNALAELDTLIAAPAVDAVPAGTLTTAQLSNVARAMRDAVQQNRAGAQRVARTLKQTIRLVRGDFDGID